jgi:hypothetical protein
MNKSTSIFIGMLRVVQECMFVMFFLEAKNQKIKKSKNQKIKKIL